MRRTDSGTVQDERDGLMFVKRLCASVSRQSALLHRSAARTVRRGEGNAITTLSLSCSSSVHCFSTTKSQSPHTDVSHQLPSLCVFTQSSEISQFAQ